MNQRVHNLSKWRFVPEGQLVRYGLDKARTVVLEVNCPSEVAFYVIQDRSAVLNDPERLSDEAAGRLRPDTVGPQPDGDNRLISFVGLCKGRDRLEFAVDGAFDLVVEGGPAYVFSADGLDIATEITAPVIFTRIANRRQRNPHLEMMEYQMRLNQERMIAELEAEQARRLDALEKRLESYVPQRDIRAPPQLVGRAEGRERSEPGDVVEADGTAAAPPDEGDGSETVVKKRRKAAAPPDL